MHIKIILNSSISTDRATCKVKYVLKSKYQYGQKFHIKKDFLTNAFKREIFYHNYIYLFVNEEYENFVNAHLESAAEFIPTKQRTKS